MTPDPLDRRGVLFPGRLPSFQRRPAPESVADLVQWYWISQWDLPAGERSVQEVLPFPASNFVIEAGAAEVFGPTTGASTRILEGRGWAFGVLLHPAGLGRLGIAPAGIADSSAPVLGRREWLDRVGAAMDTGDIDAADTAVTSWLARSEGGAHYVPSDNERLASRLVDTVAGHREITGVPELAERMGLSVRTIQRLSRRYIGLSPLQVIRRYRLQEAALRIREERASVGVAGGTGGTGPTVASGLTLARVAAELGYADQAHLAADFRRTLGFAPSEYRRDNAGGGAGLSQE